MKFLRAIFGYDRALIRKIAENAREVANEHTLAVARLNRILDEQEAVRHLRQRLIVQETREARTMRHKARVYRHPFA